MGIINKRLTDREKAAVYLHVFAGVDDRRTLYAIADDGPGKAPEMHDRSIASRWFNSDKITALIDSVRRVKYDLIKAAEDNGIEKGRTMAEGSTCTKNEKPAPVAKFVDYSSPEAQRAKLNELVNTADDPGEALDALKVIIQGQRADRDAAKDGRTVRAYIPMYCAACPMYQKARKRAEKGPEKGQK